MNNTKKLVHFAHLNEEDFDSNSSKVFKKKNSRKKNKGFKVQTVNIKVNNKLYKSKTGENTTAIHSPVTYASKLVEKKAQVE